MLLLAIILGILFGFALSYMAVAWLVYHSNDHGNSKGDFKNFSREPLHMLEQKNNIRNPL